MTTKIHQSLRFFSQCPLRLGWSLPICSIIGGLFLLIFSLFLNPETHLRIYCWVMIISLGITALGNIWFILDFRKNKILQLGFLWKDAQAVWKWFFSSGELSAGFLLYFFYMFFLFSVVWYSSLINPDFAAIVFYICIFAMIPLFIIIFAYRWKKYSKPQGGEGNAEGHPNT